MRPFVISPASLDPLTAVLAQLEAAPRPFNGAVRVLGEDALLAAVRTCELLLAYALGLAGRPSVN